MEEEPKCVRAIVTLIYSDNASVVIDIKDPPYLELIMEGLTQTEEDGFGGWKVVGSRTKVELKTQINKEVPAVISSHLVVT